MLDTDIKYLKGVGPQRAKKLDKLNIHTIEELMQYFPVKYEDRRTLSCINSVKDGDKVMLKLKICGKPSLSRPRYKMTILKAVGKDETGCVNLTFFNQEFLKLIDGESYYAYGKVKVSPGLIEMISPEIEAVNIALKAGHIVPLYGLTSGLSNNELTKLMRTALETYGKDIEDVLPEPVRKDYHLLHKSTATAYMHFPTDGRKYAAAKRTIAFERLLVMQLGLLSVKNKLKSGDDGIAMKETFLSERFAESLPYELTKAQQRVIGEISMDMDSDRPMNRLVQGDVGSGKTAVAVASMLIAAGSGYQSSMMAPTEILAAQHYETIREYIKAAGLDVQVEFLSGSTKASEKRSLLERLRAGSIDILVGTHALIEPDVIFKNIGLVVTDEQHRFGVRQRAMLSNKGKNPDMLVMTATPIPRTLALMFYGDLDISVIDEMPPGRKPVKTEVLKKSRKEDAYSFIKKSVDEGRQAYIVAPLVEESEAVELDSAEEIYNELKYGIFEGYSLGLLHGRMKSAEKDEIMEQFYKGEINILVSTTVIEVGVNVPNAVIMLVLNAERFGLAQLHQLRGRVGRGSHESYCILINESSSGRSRDRMNILKRTNDGFIIAEEDLRLRGPGEFFGTRQHGLDSCELKSLVGDVALVKEVQTLAKSMLHDDPYLRDSSYFRLRQQIVKLFRDENIVFN